MLLQTMTHLETTCTIKQCIKNIVNDLDTVNIIHKATLRNEYITMSTVKLNLLQRIIDNKDTVERLSNTIFTANIYLGERYKELYSSFTAQYKDEVFINTTQLL